jgi:outer membrane cobalamin receptor
MRYFKLFLSISFLFVHFLTTAQEITGRVMSLDAEGNMEDLIGASVVYSPSRAATLTTANGYFKLAVNRFPGWLVVSYVGFPTDSVFVEKPAFQHIHLMVKTNELNEVKVLANPGQMDGMSTIHTEMISMKTLAKAACCNLSESFETNASVSVNFTDGVTGAKQIQLLGLSGNYVQSNVENMPSIRGLKSTFGLNYTPGTWIRSIDLSKGVSSVANGYESMTGAINVELMKPDTSDRYFLNTYVNSQGRYEVNQQSAVKLNSHLSTGLLTHFSQQAARTDGNKDGFMDQPLFDLVNVLNRWKYKSDDWIIQWGAGYLRENRLAGQMSFDETSSNRYLVYGFGSSTSRFEGFAKIARLFQNKPWRGLGLILNTVQHANDSYFAFKNYKGREQSMHGNFIYQSIIGNTNHAWKAGASFLYDSYQEAYIDSAFARTEMVPGVFAEYTWTVPNHLTLVLGQRVDWHNLYGAQWIPRMHLKWDVAQDWIVRVSAGKGWRRVNPLAENMGFLANGRRIQLIGNLNPLEKSWNYGVSVSKDLFIGSRKANLVFDAYRTDFERQWMVDMETAGQLRMYASPGVSYATSVQIEFNYSPIKRLEWKLAYRWQDVQSDYWTVKGNLSRLAKPFLNKERVLVNVAYALPNDVWKFDLTWQWNGGSRIPNAQAGHIHELGGSPVTAPAFSNLNAQITKKFKRVEIYVGGENLSNFTQLNPLMNASDPFGRYFDATMVWGPIIGRMIYSGIRFNIQ